MTFAMSSKTFRFSGATNYLEHEDHVLLDGFTYGGEEVVAGWEQRQAAQHQ